MNVMVAFLFICMVLGVWSKPKAKMAPVVLVLAVLMVVAFFVSPHRM
jgi:hypothetical protein